MTRDQQLYFPPKTVVLQIFIALKNPLSSAGFEPTNLGSDGAHANHYATGGANTCSNYHGFILPYLSSKCKARMQALIFHL
jgi:hypothetical protein